MRKPGTIANLFFRRHNYVKRCIGIDVSKGKSTIAVLRPAGEIVRKPFDVRHTPKELSILSSYIQHLEGDTRILMECTGHYHEPILKVLSDSGFFVSAVKPHLIKEYDGDNSLRKVKSDPADAKKIAGYTLDKWHLLRQYSAMDNTRTQLKTLNTQFQFLMRQKTALKNNLISLLDLTYPGVNAFFDSPVRKNGSQKWLDYAYSFWHADCVRTIGLKTFTERYKKFCKRHGYIFQPDKPKSLFESSKELIAVAPKDHIYKDMVLSAIGQVNLISAQIESMRLKMDELASTLPEYEVVMNMFGVGHTFGPQLMAEIGDISRFNHRSALTAFAGVDPGVNQSGKMKIDSNRASKRGAPRLRKTLFQIMQTLMQKAPADNRVYLFMMKKKAEGKPYHVYMTAGANKFLRIYYGTVKAHLASQSQTE